MAFANNAIGSSALLITSKLIHRSLGLVSMLILARLLAPADFGLVALVSITVYFFDMLSSVGSDQYIIRKPDIAPDDLDTAWTLNLVTKLALWLVLQLSAPWAAEFFQNPALTAALRTGACVLPINALASIRLNLLKREFEYRGIFWLSLFQRIISFTLVVSLAYVLRSYWAMIIADLFASAAFTAGSYRLAPYRPRINIVKLGEQWSFSGWMLLKGLVGYTRSQIDTLFVSRLFPAAILGQYHLMREIAMLPAHNLAVPITEPLLSMFRRSREDRLQQTEHVRSTVTVMAAVIMPIAILLAGFSDKLIPVVLGPQWIEAAGLLTWLSILPVYFSLTVVYEQLILAHGNVRLLFVLDCSSTMLIIVGLLLFAQGSVEEMAIARGVAGCLSLGIIVWQAKRLTGLDGIFPVRRVLVIVAAAVVALTSVQQITLGQPATALHLCLEIICYFAIYAAVLSLGVFALDKSDRRKLLDLLAWKSLVVDARTRHR